MCILLPLASEHFEFYNRMILIEIWHANESMKDIVHCLYVADAILNLQDILISLPIEVKFTLRITNEVQQKMQFNAYNRWSLHIQTFPRKKLIDFGRTLRNFIQSIWRLTT